jgi:hypothetical protein
MKNKIYSIIIAASTLAFAGCNDFIDNEPTNAITASSLTADNMELLVTPLYTRAWFEFNSNFYFGMGDGMAYNLNAPYSDYIYPFSDLNVTGLTGPLVSAWQSLYQVVDRATIAINTIEASGVDEAVKKQYIGEARFMRGVAYWYLASLWGNVPITDDLQALTENYKVNANRKQDVYEYGIRDLEFAAKYLPATTPDAGRVNKYSAFGMLSRLYLDYSGFVASDYGSNPNVGTRDPNYLDLAKKAAEKVINESSFKLLANYADLFVPTSDLNNNAESLFSLQWVGGLTSETGYGYINTQQAYFAFGSVVTGDDAAWGGGGTGCPYDMIKEYESADIIRRKATWMGNGDHYDEINKANGGLTYNEDIFSAAPRWLSVKKGVTGSAKDYPGVVGRMNSGLNTRMLRLAEVYLNYAEAILGNNASTGDAVALHYFNAVRERAGLAPKTNITWEDLRHERRVEFCLEGRYWYDLLARSYYKQQEVINYLNGQNRGTVPPYLFDAPNDLRIDPDRDTTTRSVGTAKAETFVLPYPESELLQDPKLGETPVAFEFTEERITDLFI